MDAQKIKIEIGSPYNTRVWVDGVEQTNLTSVSLTHEVGCLPTLVLKHHHVTGQVDGEAAVEKIAVCPSCQAEHGHRAGVIAETTGLGDGWVRKEAL